MTRQGEFWLYTGLVQVIVLGNLSIELQQIMYFVERIVIDLRGNLSNTFYILYLTMSV